MVQWRQRRHLISSDVPKIKWFVMPLSFSCANASLRDKNRTVEPGGLLSIAFKSNIFIGVKHRRCLIFVIRHISGKQILVEDQLFFLIDSPRRISKEIL